MKNIIKLLALGIDLHPLPKKKDSSMKHIKALLFCLLAFACGAPDDSGLYEPDADAGVGEAAQPLVSNDVHDAPDVQIKYVDSLFAVEKSFFPWGYGTKSDGQRCWTAGDCSRRSSKTIKVVLHLEQCSNWYDTRLAAFAQLVKAEAAATGFALTVVTTNGQAVKGDVHVICNQVDFSSDGAIGWTEHTDKTCDANGNCKVAIDRITLWVKNIETDVSWSGKTDAQRQKFVDNLGKHEMYHSLGLGHADTAEPNVLMNPHSSQAEYNAVYSPTQSTMLDGMTSYVP